MILFQNSGSCSVEQGRFGNTRGAFADSKQFGVELVTSDG